MKKQFFSTALLLISTSVCAANKQLPSYGIYDLVGNSFVENYKMNEVRPIASLTKLMTANVFIKHMPKYCYNSVNEQDVDNLKGTSSKLPKNENFSCLKLLDAMLVGSDNMAASALARSLPQYSKTQFIALMNAQAQQWKMVDTKFVDASGLDPRNVSTVKDLAILAKHSLSQPLIRNITSKPLALVVKNNGNILYFKNTNRLVRELGYKTDLSKTGYIRESGYNLIYKPQDNCNEHHYIVISLGNSNSLQRSNFASSKMKQYQCSVI
jgi:D-alanyl-D-alanine endopeptidase (penicillin-binding protein 7)